MANQLAIGVDLGATKIATALINEQGKILSAGRTPTKAENSPESICKHIAKIINNYWHDATDEIVGVGIGIPGSVDSDHGIVISSVNLRWKNFEFTKSIQQYLEFDAPIHIITDTLAIATGELHYGAAQGYKHFLLLTIGSGLGGSIVTNGRVVLGAHGMAGGVGHFSIDVNGRRCLCGIRGCAETTVSGPGLVSIARDQFEGGRFSTSLPFSDDLDPQKILDAARLGDLLALEAISELGKNLGVVMAACVAILDPEMIVVGGGFGVAAYDIIMPIARQELERRVLPEIYSDLLFSPTNLESSAMGAAHYVYECGQPLFGRKHT